MAKAKAKPRSTTAEHIVWWPINRLRPNPRNSRKHPPGQIADLRKSFQTYGWVWPILARGDGEIIAGEGRWVAAKEEGFAQAKVLVADGMTEKQIQAFVIADNRLPEDATWDDTILREELELLKAANFDMGALGFHEDELEQIFSGEIARVSRLGSLAESFGVVPFSVLNARDGWWQDRKRAWIALGIQSELGRGENLLKFSETVLEPDPAKRAAKRNAKTDANYSSNYANPIQGGEV